MNILVTGASRGIGFATVLELLKKGNKVFALSRNNSGLAELIAESGKIITGSSLQTFAGDIRDEKFISSVVTGISEKEKSLQIIINNAGALINKPFDQILQEEWKEIYDTNVFGVVNVIRNFLPMIRAGEIMSHSNFRGHIVNITSMGGVQGSVKFKGLGAYSSGKGAVNVLSECLAEEFSEDKIAVNSLALGSVNTEMFRKAFPDFRASMDVAAMGAYIGEFASSGHRYYNGKILPVTFSTP